MRILGLALLTTLALTGIGCDGNYSSPTPVTPPAPSAPPSTPPPGPAPGSATAVTIPMGAATLGRAAFGSGELAVAPGTTVSWTNGDVVPHTSTSDGSGWNSGSIAPGGQFSVAFPDTGTFTYHCAIHPGMVGTVVVR